MDQQIEYWFRGKKSNGEWEYGGINDKGDCIVSHHQFIPVDPQTVGLKSPAHDVHYYGIYSGDILRLWTENKKLLLVVNWDGWKFDLDVHPNSETEKLPENLVLSDCKIVGNIWDGVVDN